jgi:hypothetical protein
MMIGRNRFFGNLDLIERQAKGVDFSSGCYVECGTWKGGTSFAIMQLPTGIREFQFFDSFAGLPKPGPRDGDDVTDAYKTGRIKHDNNTASYDEFVADAARFRRDGQTTVVTKGWFDETLPRFESDRPIAVLRLDGDWYDSTICCLRHLFDKVMPGGLVIIDDYYDWDGCAAAVHDFLAERKARERLRQTRIGGVAYLIKLPSPPAGAL